MKKMNSTAASRIQSGTAKKTGGVIPKGSFAARAMSAAAKNENKAGWPSKKEGKKSGKKRDNN
ncbi:hypothetical protein [Marinospirillum sp.]|uniref:hypothetical protein n=1 Tax=Marinospirillum sp. TaxID=2183934 RepID=UPI00385040E0